MRSTLLSCLLLTSLVACDEPVPVSPHPGSEVIEADQTARVVRTLEVRQVEDLCLGGSDLPKWPTSPVVSVDLEVEPLWWTVHVAYGWEPYVWEPVTPHPDPSHRFDPAAVPATNFTEAWSEGTWVHFTCGAPWEDPSGPRLQDPWNPATSFTAGPARRYRLTYAVLAP